MATEKWGAGSGVGFAWTDCFPAANLNSLASGSSVLSGTADITNQTALDVFADISFSLGSVVTTGTPYIAIYVYPLNQDGTTYGDGVFTAGTQSASTPGSNYWRGSAQLPVGTQVLLGMVTGIVLPPGTFRFLLQNRAGVALAASANACKYRTYNRTVI